MRSQPFFVLSYGRSGSTLLRYIVDTHPKITCPSEIDLGILADSLFHTVFYTIGQLSKDADKSYQEHLSLDKTREIISSLMGEYTKEKEKEIWCERSPYTIDHLSMIDKLYPHTQYVCLHRNCLDFAHSFLSINRYAGGPIMAPYMHRNPDSVLSAAIDYWLDKTELLMDFEQNHSNQCISMKYEDLVVNPTEILNSMFSFLDIAWDANMLDAVFTAQHDDGPGDEKLLLTKRIKSDTIGKGSVIPYEQIPKPYLTRINCINGKLGYSTVEEYYEAWHKKAIQSSLQSVTESSAFADGIAISNFLDEKAERFKALGGACKLLVTGDNGGMWLCGPTAPHVKSIENDQETPCTIIVSYEALMDILINEQNPWEVYEQGKIRISGDLDMAEQFGRLLLSM